MRTSGRFLIWGLFRQHGLDFFSVGVDQKQNTQRHGKNFRDGEGPPDHIQLSGEAQQPCRRKKDDELPDQGNDEAQHPVAQRLDRKSVV